MAKESKKINFAAPTTWVDRMNLKFVSSQDAARFVEIEVKLAKYATVSYKHNTVEVGESTRDIKSQEYTETDEPTDLKYRVTHKKRECKFDNYD